jgi:hypothetical protein
VNVKNNGGETALHAAAVLGHREMVRELIKAGADAGIKNGEGYTPADLAFLKSRAIKNEEEKKNICGVLKIFKDIRRRVEMKDL